MCKVDGWRTRGVGSRWQGQGDEGCENQGVEDERYENGGVEE